MPQPLGNRHRLTAPYQLFETRDKRYLAIGTPNDALFGKLMQVLGLDAHAGRSALRVLCQAQAQRGRAARRWSSRRCGCATPTSSSGADGRRRAVRARQQLQGGVRRIRRSSRAAWCRRSSIRGSARCAPPATRCCSTTTGPDFERPVADARRAFRARCCAELGYSAGRDPRAGGGGRDADGGRARQQDRGGGVTRKDDASCRWPAAFCTSRPTATSFSTRRSGCRRTPSSSISRIRCRRPRRRTPAPACSAYAPKIAGERVWVRVNGLETGLAEADLDAVIGVDGHRRAVPAQGRDARRGAALGRHDRRARSSARARRRRDPARALDRERARRAQRLRHVGRAPRASSRSPSAARRTATSTPISAASGRSTGRR